METAVQLDKEFSFATVDIPVLRDKSLAPMARLIFAVLCSFASVKDRTAWPSNETVADIVGVSVATVKRAYKELKDKRIITRSPRFKKDRCQASSLTRIIGHKAPCYAKKITDTEENGTEIPSAETADVETIPCTETASVEIPRVENNAEEKPSDFAQLTHEPTWGSSMSHRTRINEPYIKDSLKGEAELPNFTERPVKGNTYHIPKKQTVQGTNPKEVCTLEDAPDIMRTTAEFFLHKTGRQGLMWSEISALQQLAATQYPIRVQKEICTAVNRFLKRGQSLGALTFGYIAGSLENQPTWGKKQQFKRNPLSLTQAQIDATREHQSEEELDRELEELMAELRAEEEQRYAS